MKKRRLILTTLILIVLGSSPLLWPSPSSRIYEEDRDLAECYRLGVNSYIVKPVDFEQFTESVRHLGMYWLLMNQIP